MAGEVNVTGAPQSERFEVVKVGIAFLSKGTSTDTASVQVAHNLTYRPKIIAELVSVGSATLLLPYTSVEVSGAAAGSVSSHYAVQIDETNITFYLFTPNYGGNTLYSNAFDSTISYTLYRARAASS